MGFKIGICGTGYFGSRFVPLFCAHPCMTSVSCLGFRDDHPDGIFAEEVSDWSNPYSNETALFRTSDGGMARMNEFRRTGAGESRQTIIGTTAAYEEQAGDSGLWTHLDYPAEASTASGEPDYRRTADLVKRVAEDVSWVRELPGVEITKQNRGELPKGST